jgi:hypothetical protein
MTLKHAHISYESMRVRIAVPMCTHANTYVHTHIHTHIHVRLEDLRPVAEFITQTDTYMAKQERTCA